MGTYPVLADILAHRHPHAKGGAQLQFIELFGASFVPMQYYEPDANTSHDEYYYNTRQNALYRRLQIDDRAVWKRISE